MRKDPDPVDKYVGGRVRAARLTLRMSQEKLGEGLGVSFQQVQKYEKGTNRISASRMTKIANLLQREVAWFFLGAPGADVMTEGSAPADHGAILSTTRDGQDLAIAFNRISDPHTRVAIVNIAKAAAGLVPA